MTRHSRSSFHRGAEFICNIPLLSFIVFCIVLYLYELLCVIPIHCLGSWVFCIIVQFGFNENDKSHFFLIIIIMIQPF